MKNLITIKGKLLANPVILTRYVTPIDEKIGYNETIVSIYVEVENPRSIMEPKKRILYYAEKEVSSAKCGIGKLASSLATQIAFSSKEDKVFIEVEANKIDQPTDKIVSYYDYTTQLGNLTQGK